MIKVAIKGLGLIGTSLALALKKQTEEVKIYGLDKQQTSLDFALSHGIIDECLTSLADLSEIDYLLLAGPVSVIIEDIHSLRDAKVKAGLVVLDVGSSKQSIMQAATTLPSTITFIGGHPMAGSHKSGVRAGRSDLFENAFFFLLPTNEQSQAKLASVKSLLAPTKAKWLEITPTRHDLIVGQISHLPHIIAAGLVNQTNEQFKHEPLGLQVAAGGFKSLTRIAAADPTMWTAICLNNQTVILKELAAYQETLAQIKQQLVLRDGKAIQTFFAQAQQVRRNLEHNSEKGSHPYYDLFLNIPDRPGEIAKITQKLAQANLNLVNIQILEVREEVNGVLHLTFGQPASLETARNLLAGEYELVEREWL